MRGALGWLLLGAVLGALAVGAWWRRSAERAQADFARLKLEAAGFQVRQARIDSALRAGVARFTLLADRDRAREDSLARLEAVVAGLERSLPVLRAERQAARHALTAAQGQKDSLGAALAALTATERERDSLERLVATTTAQVGTWRARFEDQVRRSAQLEIDQREAEHGRQEALGRVARLEAIGERLAAAPRPARLLGFLPRPTCGPGVGVAGATLTRLVRDGTLKAWELLTVSCQLAF